MLENARFFSVRNWTLLIFCKPKNAKETNLSFGHGDLALFYSYAGLFYLDSVQHLRSSIYSCVQQKSIVLRFAITNVIIDTTIALCYNQANESTLNGGTKMKLNNFPILICAVSIALALVACGGSSKSEAEKPIESVSSETASSESASEEQTAASEESNEPEIVSLDDIKPMELKLDDIIGTVGLTREQLAEQCADLIFVESQTDAGATVLQTNATVVDSDGTLAIVIMDDSVIMTSMDFNPDNMSSLLIGDKYMKIRNTLNLKLGDPSYAYEPAYGSVSSSQIAIDYESGKEILERWTTDGVSIELYLVNAEDSVFMLGAYVPNLEDLVQ